MTLHGSALVIPEVMAVCVRALLPQHLADQQGVVVEALDEEQHGRGGQLQVVPQQQRQEADGDVFKLPGPSGPTS